MTQDLEPWLGRRQTVTDTISVVQVRQMAATLDDAVRMTQPDSAALPAGWHWLYFNPMEIQSSLAVTGIRYAGTFCRP
jgi:3-methylfumaryl-CoA hydratase